ncbi:hypothetical protein [Paenibacillus aceti]|uniref:hypothetical protein n=1 Tax=Paenibacillus aceti TaxID=1820010 RepID=UPI001E3250DF|nr:hypothetical protein [Paenibacillus aceti]
MGFPSQLNRSEYLIVDFNRGVVSSGYLVSPLGAPIHPADSDEDQGNGQDAGDQQKVALLEASFEHWKSSPGSSQFLTIF